MSVEKGQRTEINPTLIATRAKHSASRSQILHYGLRKVSFCGKFTSAAVSVPAVAIYTDESKQRVVTLTLLLSFLCLN